jgi:O-antigen/teichoic acid export membrane protein
VLFFISDSLLSLFYGARYAGNGMVAFILALRLVAASIEFSFSRALFAMERADIDFKVNFIPLFVLFTFGLWLVYSYGPLGAAIGLLISYVAASVVRGAFFAILSRSFTNREK